MTSTNAPPRFSTRQAAAGLLRRVLEEDAYAHLALASMLERHTGLSGPDRGFITELLYGTLRHLPRLDSALRKATNRPLKRVDGALLALCRVAAYEALVLGTADHALVNEAVDAARRLRGPNAGGFVNGMLRGLLRLRDAGTLIPTTAATVDGVVERTGLLPWLAADVSTRLGLKDADAFGQACLQRPLMHLCVPLANRRDAVIDALAARGTPCAPHPWCPTGVVLETGAGSMEDALNALGSDALVQNVASQAVALWGAALARTHGPRVLDLCAAPGGKSAVLAAQGFHVVSGDLHLSKLHLARRQWARLKVAPHAVALDGRAPPFQPGSFDVVVLDAPCTGTGLLSRRPDISAHRKAEDVASLAQLQAQLLDAASSLVRPGGALLYSVCSVTRAEGPGVVEAFAASQPTFTRQVCPLPVPADALEDGGLTLWPHRHAVDGFYAAALVRAG